MNVVLTGFLNNIVSELPKYATLPVLSRIKVKTPDHNHYDDLMGVSTRTQGLLAFESVMAKIAVWISRVLIILIAYVAATIALRYVPVDEQRVIVAEPLTQQNIAALPSPTIEEITRDAAQYHIFGITGSKPVVKIEREVAPEVTVLDLTLFGVYWAQQIDEARAIVSANGEPEDVFRIGDTIIEHVKLYKVFPKEIVIDNGGRKEIVKLRERFATDRLATEEFATDRFATDDD